MIHQASWSKYVVIADVTVVEFNFIEISPNLVLIGTRTTTDLFSVLFEVCDRKEDVLDQMSKI